MYLKKIVLLLQKKIEVVVFTHFFLFTVQFKKKSLISNNVSLRTIY